MNTSTTASTGNGRMGLSLVYDLLEVFVSALIVVAIIALFSASSTLVYQRGSVLGPIGSQMAFIVLGVLAAFVIQYIPSYWVRFGGYALLAISTLLVYSTMIPGNPLVVTINGAARWVRIAGITFQPSVFSQSSESRFSLDSNLITPSDQLRGK